jgi:tetratricopeptide (TPR) repeat protein
MNSQAAYQEIIATYERGEFDQALELADRALKNDPLQAQIRFKRAIVLLTLGRWTEAWRDYELRTIFDPQLNLPLARWQGQPFTHAALLVIAEQGLGDTLQFARYLEWVKQRGGQVHLACNPNQWSLLGRAVGIDWVGDQINIHDFRYQHPLMSLPGLFGSTPATVPAHVPYLHADPESVARVRREIPGAGQLRIALCAGGQAKNEMSWKRDIPPALFERLAGIRGVQYFNVSPGQPPLAGAVDYGPRVRDFDEAAAIVANLDLVITCDTALAHLAGGLGKPVWVALPLVPDWRWLLEREDTPWYPTMWLVRQRRLGDWEDVLGRIEAELHRRQARPEATLRPDGRAE